MICQNSPSPKLVGADVELGNSIEGWPYNTSGNAVAASLVLGAIKGVPHFRPYPAPTMGFNVHGVDRENPYSTSATSNDELPRANCQDWGRKYLPTTGGSAYIDLEHLEIPLPEVRSATDFNAAWHAALRIVDQSTRIVNERFSRGRVHVVANNSDGKNHSYGAHLNVLVSRTAFENIIRNKPHHLAFLASHQVSSIVFAGQGKVGSENGRPPVNFQISQRADFFEELRGLQTTYRRPIVNSRDEALCGESSINPEQRNDDQYARLHVIFYDSNVADVANVLKVGTLQMITAMCEMGAINLDCLLDDPLGAVVRWSHDPQLRSKARLANGHTTTAVDLQRRIVDAAIACDERGDFDGIVPDAAGLIVLWNDVLDRFARLDFESLRGSIDWVLKKHLLEQYLRNRDLTWDSPEARHLDWMYANLDPDLGLHWACRRQGLVDRLSLEADILRFMSEPPEDTRAWCRAKLLSVAGDSVSFVDWDQIEFLVESQRGDLVRRKLNMSDPMGMTKHEVGHFFRPGRPLGDLLDDLDACQHQPRAAVSVTV